MASRVEVAPLCIFVLTLSIPCTAMLSVFSSNWKGISNEMPILVLIQTDKLGFQKRGAVNQVGAFFESLEVGDKIICVMVLNCTISSLGRASRPENIVTQQKLQHFWAPKLWQIQKVKSTHILLPIYIKQVV
jgi:hypothetical protein